MNGASAVWNVRATSGGGSDTPAAAFSPPRTKKTAKRCTTPVKAARPAGRRSTCHLDRLPDNLLVKIMSYLTSLDIVNVSRTCKKLYFLSWEPDLWTTLSLTAAPHLDTDRAIKSILEVLARNSGLSALRCVVLNGSTRLTDRGLGLLARRAGQLGQLEVQHCPGVTNGGLLDLVARCPRLHHLDLTGRGQFYNFQISFGFTKENTFTYKYACK